MRNFLVVAGLVLVTFVGWSGTSPAAATPICEQVGTSGLVNFHPNPVCVPYPLETTCLTGDIGLEPTLVVHHMICWPSPL